MNRKFQIGIDGSGVDEFLKGIEEYQRWLKERAEVLVNRLAEEGFNVASAGFANAVYDGTNDASVSVEERGDSVQAVVVVGSSVLFIEFGTGVTYPDNHPEAAELGMVRGVYGKGHGKQKSWGYYGEPGTNGEIRKSTPNGDLIITQGNPANMPMYNAVKQLKEKLPEMVKEVFSR